MNAEQHYFVLVARFIYFERSFSIVSRDSISGQLPPKDAVRVEEMINYFSYNYPQPTDDHPVKMVTETTMY